MASDLNALGPLRYVENRTKCLMKSFALSGLAQRRLMLGSEFTNQFAHHWLVWEPGVWKVPRGTAGDCPTISPQMPPQFKPSAKDPLCFVLLSRNEASSFNIGRALGNDLVLSDGTVSRNHCSLARSGESWVVTCSSEAKSLKIDDITLKSGESVEIRTGQRMLLGHIALTLLDPKAMLQRLDSLPLHLV